MDGSKASTLSYIADTEHMMDQMNGFRERYVSSKN